MARVVVKEAVEVSPHDLSSPGPFEFANALAFRNGRLAVGVRSSVAIFDASGLCQWVKNAAPDTAWLAYVPGRSAIVTKSHVDARGACTRVVNLDSGESTVMRGPVCVARDGTSIASNKRAYRVGDRDDVVSNEVALQAAPAKSRAAFSEGDKSFLYGSELINLGADTYRARALVASDDGAFHAIGYDHRAVVDVYRSDGTLHLELEAGGYNTLALAFSPSGERLLTGSVLRGPLKVWHLADGAQIAEVATDFAPRRPGTTAVFVSDDVLAYVGEGRVTRLWRLSTGERLTLQIKSRAKWAAYSDDGRYVGSPTGLKELAVYDGEERTAANAPTPDLLADFLS